MTTWQTKNPSVRGSGVPQISGDTITVRYDGCYWTVNPNAERKTAPTTVTCSGFMASAQQVGLRFFAELRRETNVRFLSYSRAAFDYDTSTAGADFGSTGNNPDSEGTTTYTMKINSNGTASFLREGRYTGAAWYGTTYNHTGTLSREGASLVASGPQTTTTTTSQTTPTATTKNPGDLSVAKPVPNKPGLVYNPFDPSSRILLDVRGKASGTKLIEPKSGKTFTVP
jgi:hypothetical protein